MATTKAARRNDADNSAKGGFSPEEIAAARERAQELKRAARKGATAADGVRDVLAKIAEMPESDRVMAQRLHELITAAAPDLVAKTWYGMPAYARDGKVVCFFKAASKFSSRYATFGFEEEAQIDDGTMWPTSFGLTKLTPADEKRISELVKKAVS